MPFEVEGDEPLTEKIAVRLTAAEKVRLQEDAAEAGLTVSALVRRRYFGRRIVPRVEADAIRELRRAAGLVKHLYNESNKPGNQSLSPTATADALTALSNAAKLLIYQTVMKS